MNAGNINPALLAQSRLGLAMLAGGQAGEAATVFRAITQAAPDWTIGWNNLALAEVEAKRLADAIEPFRHSLALDPDQDQTRTSLAMTLLRLGQVEQAAAACREIVARRPASDAAWNMLGLIHLRLEQFDEAADCFAAAILHGKADAALFANYGLALLQAGRFGDALQAHAAAASLEPSYAGPGTMGEFVALVAAIADGDVRAAIERYEQARGDPNADLPQALKTAYLLFLRFDRRDAAIAVADAWRTRCPESAEARHLSLAAAGAPLDTADPVYVAQHFDRYAERFEANVLDDLKYAVPDRLESVLAQLPSLAADLDILDAGCGTGLCAAALRKRAKRLVGVDLSAGMIAKAAVRGLYDRLILGNLMEALAESGGAYDVILAADVMIYLGALPPVFEAAFHALRPGGSLIFSTEDAEDASVFMLRASGRFAHGRDYVRQSALPWFDVVQSVDLPIRREGLKNIDGQIVTLLRRDAKR